jgi:hypothetical protein
MVKKFGKDVGASSEKLRKAFDTVNFNGSGDITPEDARVFLRSTYPSLADDDPLFSQVFQALNIDGSTIVWEEFEKIFLEQ